LPFEDLRNATVRQIFHLSVGGPVLRVHLSNAFGVEPLHIASVHVARPLSPSASTIDIATIGRDLRGKADVTIPPGAEFASDPLPFAIFPCPISR